MEADARERIKGHHKMEADARERAIQRRTPKAVYQKMETNLWHKARKARRAVVPFIINITIEINFSSKVYSKSLQKVGPL